MKLLSEKIQDFLKSSNNDYDYCTFKTENLPDGNGYCVIIDYGVYSDSLQISVFIDGQPDNFRIYEYKPYRIAPYTFDVWMEAEYDLNVLTFLNKLWNFIEKAVTSLENSNKK